MTRVDLSAGFGLQQFGNGTAVALEDWMKCSEQRLLGRCPISSGRLTWRRRLLCSADIHIDINVNVQNPFPLYIGIIILHCQSSGILPLQCSISLHKSLSYTTPVSPTTRIISTTTEHLPEPLPSLIWYRDLTISSVPRQLAKLTECTDQVAQHTRWACCEPVPIRVKGYGRNGIARKIWTPPTHYIIYSLCFNGPFSRWT